jgi:hypothetical protein
MDVAHAPTQGRRVFHVRAFRDEEAKVRVVNDTDVPGLVTEAATFEALEAKLRVMVPELLALNRPAGADERENQDLLFERTAAKEIAPSRAPCS